MSDNSSATDLEAGPEPALDAPDNDKASRTANRKAKRHRKTAAAPEAGPDFAAEAGPTADVDSHLFDRGQLAAALLEPEAVVEAAPEPPNAQAGFDSEPANHPPEPDLDLDLTAAGPAIPPPTPTPTPTPAPAPAAATSPRARRKAKKRSESIALVPLDRLKLPGHGWRSRERPERVERLAAAMRHHGFLGALTGRQQGKQIELAYGELRVAAARLAGLETIPVRVCDLDDATFFELALQENFLRLGLTPLDEARAVRRMQEQGYDIETIAERLGRPVPAIIARLALLRYPEIEEALRQESIDPLLAEELASIEDGPMRNKLLRQAVAGKLRRLYSDLWAARQAQDGGEQSEIEGVAAAPGGPDSPGGEILKPFKLPRKAARKIRSLPPADQLRSLASLVSSFEATLEVYDLAALAADNEMRRKTRKLLKSMKQELNKRLDMLD